ncbi:MAG: Wzz/FepE/Etk N-terminal domain-containing protein [Bacteroidales bacterium]|nr:Wzz/FepE/Etk N-terminal domain-containing protein [Bacteroidales bacterium]
MVNKFPENGDFDSSGFLYFLYYWRKPLIIIALVAIFASILFSSPWFITPKYKSTVILFPVATNSISKALISQQSGIKEDVLGFGEEEQAEQMLQILNSNKIRDRVVEMFNLREHYGIDDRSRYKNTRLMKEYENNVSFRRTEFMAVKISVLDKDPQMAADIANTIAELVDSTKTQMQKDRAMRAFNIVEKEYVSLQKEISEIVDSLKVIGRLGVNDYESQSEVINQQLAIALRNGDMRAVLALEERLKVLAEYGGSFLSLKNTLEFKSEQLTLLKAKYQEAKVDAESELPQKFVVNYAFKAEKKSYPIRWIIVLVSTFAALLLAILTIITIENFSKIKKKSLSFNFWSFGNSQSNKKSESTETKKEKDKLPDKEKSVVQKEEKKEIIAEKKAVGEKQKTKEENSNNKTAVEEKSSNAEPIKTKDKPYTQGSSEEKSNNLFDMKTYSDNSNLVGIILKWWVHIVIIAVIAVLLGVLFSSSIFITPKYKSYAVVYPHNIAPYSDESETEQMLQLLQSKDIKDSVIKKFDLAAHYEVDSNFKYFYSTIYYEYSQNVNINKTPYESVEITVLDKDPFLANEMVYAIIHFYNKKVRKVHNDKYLEVIRMYEAILAKKQAHMDSLKGRLQTLSTEYGLIEYESQAEEITKGYLRTVMGASTTNINQSEVMRLKENIEQHGGELIEIVEAIKNESKNLALLKVDYENAVRFYTDELTYANIVTPPYPADKKSYPVRWLIVMFTLIATVFLTIVIILIIERYRHQFRVKK